MDENVLVLRTCAADMTSHNGFVCPRSGPVKIDEQKIKFRCGTVVYAGGMAGALGDAASAARGRSVGQEQRGLLDGRTKRRVGHRGIDRQRWSRESRRPNGLLVVTYWVEGEKRYRARVGCVGEDGIKSDTWYVVKDGHLQEQD